MGIKNLKRVYLQTKCSLYLFRVPVHYLSVPHSHIYEVSVYHLPLLSTFGNALNIDSPVNFLLCFNSIPVAQKIFSLLAIIMSVLFKHLAMNHFELAPYLHSSYIPCRASALSGTLVRYNAFTP